MAQINLLPWREELREERKREFIVLLTGILIIAFGVLFLVDRYYRGEISNQQARNDFLNREILVLDARIEEINQLQQQKQQINDRMSVIQDLQGSRPVIVRIFDELVRTLPSGVYYNTLERIGDTLEISGVAASNNKVSELMRRLDNSDWFAEPNLIQISALENQNESVAGATPGADSDRANVFSLTLELEMPAREGED